jgi:hypothetical protein
MNNMVKIFRKLLIIDALIFFLTLALIAGISNFKIVDILGYLNLLSLILFFVIAFAMIVSFDVSAENNLRWTRVLFYLTTTSVFVIVIYLRNSAPYGGGGLILAIPFVTSIILLFTITLYFISKKAIAKSAWQWIYFLAIIASTIILIKFS